MNFGRYEIERELGKGAMGVVYLAHDPEIDRKVALKVLRQDRVSGEDFVHRFLKEARAIGRLSHPNIVTVFDVGHDHGTIYIAMEFIDGKPLDELVRETPPGFQEIVDIGSQVADTLSYTHEKGIIHRDIKPSNIMLTRDGRVKITDFGIAHIEDAAAPQMTQAGEILGTPNYMSPEQVKGQKVDGRSDLYSLGVILYELSTGKRPYGGKNLAAIFAAILQEKPSPPLSLEPFVARGLPATLSDVISRSIEKEPEARFQDGSAMARALKECLAPISSQKPLPEKKSRRGVLISLFLVLLLLAVGGGILFSKKKGSDPAPPQASLSVTSDPAGAQLYVDGVFKGPTPLRINIPAGSHEVRLSLPEYYEWEGELTLETTEETPLDVRLVKIE